MFHYLFCHSQGKQSTSSLQRWCYEIKGPLMKWSLRWNGVSMLIPNKTYTQSYGPPPLPTWNTIGISALNECLCWSDSNLFSSENTASWRSIWLRREMTVITNMTTTMIFIIVLANMMLDPHNRCKHAFKKVLHCLPKPMLNLNLNLVDSVLVVLVLTKLLRSLPVSMSMSMRAGGGDWWYILRCLPFFCQWRICCDCEVME